MSSLSSARIISDLTASEKELLCEEIGAYLNASITAEEFEYLVCIVNDGLDWAANEAECEAGMMMCIDGGWARGDMPVDTSWPCSPARNDTECRVPLDMFEGCVSEVAGSFIRAAELTCADAPLDQPWEEIPRYRSAACNAWLESCRVFVFR